MNPRYFFNSGEAKPAMLDTLDCTELDVDAIEAGFNASRFRTKTLVTPASTGRKAAQGRRSMRIVFSTKLFAEHALVIKNCSADESYKLGQLSSFIPHLRFYARNVGDNTRALPESVSDQVQK